MSRPRSQLTPLLLASITLGVACSDPAPTDVPEDDAGVVIDTGSTVDAGATTDRGATTDTALVDVPSADVVAQDVAAPDAGELDVITAEDVPAAIDVPSPIDTGTPDTGTPDVGAPDTGTPDVGAFDSGSLDAGPADTGPADTGPLDSGTPDAGAPDAGAPDTGTPDAGPMSARRFGAASGWVVPPNGHSDGFYAAALGIGTRWWALLDMDGDRRPDLAQTGDPTRSGGYVFNANTPTASWRVFLNTGTSFSTTATTWSVPNIGLSDGPYATTVATGTRWWSTFDINGDGRPDLVQTGDPTRSGGYVFNANTPTAAWRVFLNTGTGFSSTPTMWTVPNIGLTDGPYTTNIATGTRWWSTFDIDGDRRPDLVQTGDPTRSGGYVFNANTPMASWRVFLNTGTGFSTTATPWTVPNVGLSDGPYTANIATGTRWWSTFDIDGDGRPDLVQTGDPTRSGGYVFNANTPSASWRVFLNTGTGFSTTATTWPVPNVGHTDGPYTANIATGTRWWSTMDLDGDRRPDLVQTGDPTRSGGYVFNANTPMASWRVFLNTGSGFATTGTSWPAPAVGLTDGPYTTAIATGTRWWVTLDLNGDGLADFAQTGDPARSGGYVFGSGGSTHTWRVSLGQ